MRLVLMPQARSLLRRARGTTVYSLLELLLLTLLAVQCARLLWVAVTPVGPVGEWKALGADRASAASPELLGSFDPFFRGTAQGAPLVVTSLNLKLFGVREDRASGRGSAIIALPDGVQHSFAVNEEILPGVILVQVAADHVTIARNGSSEQLFLDQSEPAATVPAESSTAPAAPSINFAPGAANPPTPAAPAQPPLRITPRTSGSAVTGVVVQPTGDGAAFRASGFQPGDVIVSVNGQRITSAQQAQSLGASLGSGDVDVQVERGGRVMPLRVKVNQ